MIDPPASFKGKNSIFSEANPTIPFCKFDCIISIGAINNYDFPDCVIGLHNMSGIILIVLVRYFHEPPYK